MAMSGVNKAGVGLGVLGAVALGLGLANLRLKMISEAAMIALATGGGVVGVTGLTMALVRKRKAAPLKEKDFLDLGKQAGPQRGGNHTNVIAVAIFFGEGKKLQIKKHLENQCKLQGVTLVELVEGFDKDRGLCQQKYSSLNSFAPLESAIKLIRADLEKVEEVSWDHQDSSVLDAIAIRAEENRKNADDFAKDLKVLYSSDDKARTELLKADYSGGLVRIELDRGMTLDQMLEGWDKGDYFGGPRGDQSQVELLRGAIAILKESRIE